MEQLAKLRYDFRLPLKIIFLFFSANSYLFAQELPKDTTAVSHTFYIVSETGPGAGKNTSDILTSIAKASEKDQKASLLFLGNITPERGYPELTVKRSNIENFLEEYLLEPLKQFHGNVIFIPGENEWRNDAPQSLDDLESFLQQNSKYEFWPDDGCPIEEQEINDQIVLISVDSQWYFEDWDRSSDFNSDCNIKDRERFFTAFKDDLKDNHGKIKLVAIHHPILNNASGGFFNQVFPFSVQEFENPVYREFRKRIETLASQFDDVIFISGNSKTLQYLHNERNPQIISATASNSSNFIDQKKESFLSDSPGYARLQIFENGNSEVAFFHADNENPILFQTSIPGELETEIETHQSLDDSLETISSSIYSEEETTKSGFYKFLFGNNYREIYSKKIRVPVLDIEALDPSLDPIKEGGGQQSRSLRFKDNNDHEYTLRALRKDPIRYLQADLSPNNYIGDLLDSTVARRVVLDFFTTSHPYAKYAIDNFSETLDIPHIQPQVYYLPKQPALEIHNDEYGNALYEMQVHAGDENKSFAQFDNPDDIISTYDLLEELREDPDAVVDEEAYIKTRLLDMLVGDWDRHQDQWRWAEYNTSEVKRYVPIPRDRDQSFSKYDGNLISFLKLSVPLLRKMQSYDEEIKNIKWFNWSGYPLDLQILYKTSWKDWEEQVIKIQSKITDEQIETAFKDLPEDARDSSIESIKKLMKSRRSNLLEIARTYYERLQKFSVITGTEETDTFSVHRQGDHQTKITQTSEGKEVFSHLYGPDTEEIWIYGLAGEDIFSVSGDGKPTLKLRILGGTGNDRYDIQKNELVKIYDYKSTSDQIIQRDVRRLLVDSYEINRFDFQKFKHEIFKLMPYANFETDAGFTLGARGVWTKYGLVNNPFKARHELLANYYFDTQGYAVRYNGEFAHLFYGINLGIDAGWTSPNYTLNYFGEGTETDYPEHVGKEFHRMKIAKWYLSPSLIWRSEAGSQWDVRALLESNEVQRDAATFLAKTFNENDDLFEEQVYLGGEMSYHFYSKNNKAFPNLGSEINLTVGYKNSLGSANNEFAYLQPELSIDYPLIPSGYAVFATKLGGEFIFGDNYEIYHAATIGGNNSLRGYRNHRFNGKQAFYHSTDLRTALGVWKNNFLPMVYGVSAGFDYGRVWLPGENSGLWHNNYGGSLWISAGLAVTGTIGLYHGGDGNRIAVTLNFKY